MGRGTLASDEALYLPVNSIHMLFMRFPIDGAVPGCRGCRGGAAGSRHDPAPAWTGLRSPGAHAAGVVELPAGAIERVGLMVGDAVRLVEHSRS